MNIRPYRPDDAAATLEVFRRAVGETAARHYTPDQIASWLARSGDLHTWHNRLHDTQAALVVEDASGIYAYATLRPAEGDAAEIDQVMVHPRRAREGAATALLIRLEDEARAMGVARLLARASLVSRNVFARRGFTVRAEQSVLGMTCFAMEKRLAGD